MQNTIKQRQRREQSLLLEQLKKTPIVQIACEKTNIGRTTYYRWRKQSSKFAQAADQAMAEGCLLMNDIAESQLLTAIKNNNFQALKFWLQNHHPNYTQKLHVSGTLRHEHEDLTPEQRQLVRRALKLITLKRKPHVAEE